MMAPVESADEEAFLALPLLDLDAPPAESAAAPAAPTLSAPTAPPAIGLPSLGVSPFLEAFDPRAVGAGGPGDDEEDDGERRQAPHDDASSGGEPDAEEEEDGRPAPRGGRRRPTPGDDSTRRDGRRGRAETAEEEPEEDDAEEASEEPDDVAGPSADVRDRDTPVREKGWWREIRRPPPPPEPPDPVAEAEAAAAAAAAVERVRVRAAKVVESVPATVTTDDGVLETVADVAPWFAEASEGEVRDLLRERWGGDAAVDLVRTLAPDDPELDEMVRQARRTDAELVVEVDARAAVAWLRHHRPELAERLGTLLR
jgi:hypothetical protein